MAVDLSMPVLVVDDYNTMIRIIRNLLKQLGFENIDDASDGSAAPCRTTNTVPISSIQKLEPSGMSHSLTTLKASNAGSGASRPH